MVASKKPQALGEGLSHLQLIGLWGKKPRPVYRYFVMLAMETVFIFIPKIVFGPEEEGFDAFACNLAELMFLGEVVISIGLFNYRARSFEKLVAILRVVIKRLEANKTNAEEIQAAVRKTEKFCRMYMMYFWLIVILYLARPLISTLIGLIFHSDNERGKFMMIMMMKFYWMEISRNTVHYGISYVFIALSIVCSAYQSMLKITVISASIQYGGTLFDSTALKIKHLEGFAKGTERRNELREIIEVHQLALKYVLQLEETVSILLLNQLTWCVLIMCLMMYYISTSFGENTINIVIMFIVMMGEMAFFCFNGTMLNEKAIEMGRAMYSYAWYLEPVTMQKDVKLIIARSQRRTAITAANFYVVNRERLAIIIQTAYSYYLILKNAFEAH